MYENSFVRVEWREGRGERGREKEERERRLKKELNVERGEGGSRIYLLTFTNNKENRFTTAFLSQINSGGHSHAHWHPFIRMHTICTHKLYFSKSKPSALNAIENDMLTWQGREGGALITTSHGKFYSNGIDLQVCVCVCDCLCVSEIRCGICLICLFIAVDGRHHFRRERGVCFVTFECDLQTAGVYSFQLFFFLSFEDFLTFMHAHIHHTRTLITGFPSSNDCCVKWTHIRGCTYYLTRTLSRSLTLTRTLCSHTPFFFSHIIFNFSIFPLHSPPSSSLSSPSSLHSLPKGVSYSLSHMTTV